MGIDVLGVRLDSGDLGEHAGRVRKILDAADLQHLTIFASGNLDECSVAKLISSGAPIDGFGIGTRLDASRTFPIWNACAYKIQESRRPAVAKAFRGEGDVAGSKASLSIVRWRRPNEPRCRGARRANRRVASRAVAVGHERRARVAPPVCSGNARRGVLRPTILLGSRGPNCDLWSQQRPTTCASVRRFANWRKPSISRPASAIADTANASTLLASAQHNTLKRELQQFGVHASACFNPALCGFY